MDTQSKKEKTVYILGAGFSVPAGYPLQASILEKVQSRAIPDVMNFPKGLLPKIGLFENDVMNVQNFITHVYGENSSPRLEDIFTLLDQTISSKKSCRGYSWRDLVEIDFSLRRSILFLFHNISNDLKKSPISFYSSLGKHFLQQRKDPKGEKFSIISLNWDDLVEESIYDEIVKKKLERKADVDYCCFTVPLDEETPHTPSLFQKAKGILNLKILKLHGSTNWLMCPNCDRIFTGVGSKENRWEKYANPRVCSCQSSHGKNKIDDPSYTLQPFFVTPTYLKSFNNPHIQTIWNNAYIEISEATKIVFIGYSLPEADYHLRSLLVRSIQKGTKIDVVLTSSDKPSNKVPKNLHMNFATHRYEKIFGDYNVNFFHDGVEGYFSKLKPKTRVKKAKSGSNSKSKKRH